jgi:hypothetical protein
VAAAFAAFGALCVFRAQALAARIRQWYAKSGFSGAWPVSSVVMRPWYPWYLCFMGLVVWGAEAVVLYLVFFPDAAR